MSLLSKIGSHLAPLTILGAVVAFVHPPTFLVFEGSFLWFFAATMLALGVVLEPRELSETLRRPQRILLGVATQFTVMPLLGFAVASLGGLSPELALGFVIVGAAPGAMASNVIVYLAGGAAAFSIGMTTLATFLSPLLTPVLVKSLGGVFLPVEIAPLMVTIVQTVLAPLVLGMGLRRVLGSRLELARRIAPAVATVAIVVICSYAVAANRGAIAGIGPKVIGCVVLVNAAGYAAGWSLARLYGFDRRHQVALAIEIGMQNAGLGVALALKHFRPETAVPGTLFAFWCILTAAGATAWLKREPRDETAAAEPGLIAERARQ